MTSTKYTRGGARPGAGRPRKEEQRDDVAAFHRARTRKESALAQIRECEAGALSGRLYDRGEVLRIFATAVAVFAEQIRSIPDKLERQAGIMSAQAEIAEHVIDDPLEMIRDRLLEAVPNGTHTGVATILRAMAEQLEHRGTA